MSELTFADAKAVTKKILEYVEAVVGEGEYVLTDNELDRLTQRGAKEIMRRQQDRDKAAQKKERNRERFPVDHG